MAGLDKVGFSGIFSATLRSSIRKCCSVSDTSRAYAILDRAMLQCRFL